MAESAHSTEPRETGRPTAVRTGDKLIVTQELANARAAFKDVVSALMIVTSEKSKYFECTVLHHLEGGRAAMRELRLFKADVSLVEHAPADALTPEALLRSRPVTRASRTPGGSEGQAPQVSSPGGTMAAQGAAVCAAVCC